MSDTRVTIDEYGVASGTVGDPTPRMFYGDTDSVILDMDDAVKFCMAAAPANQPDGIIITRPV